MTAASVAAAGASVAALPPQAERTKLANTNTTSKLKAIFFIFLSPW
jgi:hypothetical protein